MPIRTVDNIALLVTRLRLEHGLDQAQLAAAAGVSRSMISYVESGARIPSTTVLLDLLAALDAELVVIRR